jgi:heme/copper-type cytochrome/quinol oxidase subunit 2
MDILLDDVRPSPDEIAEYFENVTKLKAVIHYNITFDSTMISVEDLNSGESRLYQVSDFVVLPVGVPIKVLITSADVLHS